MSGVDRRCSIEDCVPVTVRAGFRDVDVGNDQLRISYIRLYQWWWGLITGSLRPSKGTELGTVGPVVDVAALLSN